MLNNITLQGRLTRDPGLRKTQNGTEVTNVSIAVPRDYSEQGNVQTEFIDIIAWRTTAEFLAKHFHKGDLIVLSGRLQTMEYTDRENNKRKVTEVVADRVYFGSSKNENKKTELTTEDFKELDDDELPF